MKSLADTLEPFKAHLSDDGATLHMQRGTWRCQVPASHIEKWVKLYTGLRDRVNGRYAAIYEPCVTELKRVEALINQGKP